MLPNEDTAMPHHKTHAKKMARWKNQSPDPFTEISSFQQAQLSIWILTFRLKRKTDAISKTICSLGITDNGQSPETQYRYPSIYKAQNSL
jgi:hypothetical protein